MGVFKDFVADFKSMKKFKRFRIAFWFTLLCIFGFVIFPIGYADEDALMFYGGFVAIAVLQAIIRLEFGE